MEINDNTLWSSLIQLRQSLMDKNEAFYYAIIYFLNDKLKILINETDKLLDSHPSLIISTRKLKTPSGCASFIISDELLDVSLNTQGHFSLNQIEFLKNYLPYALIPIAARKNKRAIAISHFAQSLDGKIATKTGNSQWIGNKENLIHAHRMRALSDAVIIGTKTLLADNPTLTVRKVKGQNPVKVVIGNSKTPNFHQLEKNNGKVVYITSNQTIYQNNGVEVIHSNKTDTKVCTYNTLEKLFKKGIHSVYIEGGSKTASHFLESNAIDIIQLHIAPIIMGSGITNFTLPDINTISESVCFKRYYFTPFGDHIMFSGEVKKKDNES